MCLCIGIAGIPRLLLHFAGEQEKIYGKHRVAVGGKTKGKETDSEDDDAAEEVKAEGEVPPALEANAEGKQKEAKTRFEER